MKIALGTVQFGLDYGVSNSKGQTSLDEVKKILSTAKAFSIDTLDTARAYGESEDILGQSMSLKDFKVVSKFSPSVDGCSVLSQFNTSLEKLKILSLYGYLSHKPLSLIDNPNDWLVLSQLKKDGLIKKIGFSLNTTSELNFLLDKGFEPDLIQVPYNFLDRRFENHMKSLQKRGCEIHSRSTFLQGLFFMDANLLPSFFDEVKSTIFELQKNKNLAKSLMNFVLNKPFIDKVIVGVENHLQLLENVDDTTEIEQLEKLQVKFSESVLLPMNWPKK